MTQNQQADPKKEARAAARKARLEFRLRILAQQVDMKREKERRAKDNGGSA